MRPFETTLTKQKVQFDCLNSGGPEEEGAKLSNFDIDIDTIFTENFDFDPYV